MAVITTLSRALVALFEHIASSDKPALIDYDRVQKWPSGALKLFLRLGLVTPASADQSIECKGCENHCFMDVLIRAETSITRAFIVCDVPEKQNQMGRIEIPVEHLQQWQCSTKQLARVLQSLLSMTNDISDENLGIIRLGMLEGKGGRRWISLLNQPLMLEINGFKTPVNELLFIYNDELAIDKPQIDELLNAKPFSVGKNYVFSTAFREEKKLQTKAKYQDWQDEYQTLKIKYPTMNKSWCARKISKMPIGQGNDSETIRKHLK